MHRLDGAGMFFGMMHSLFTLALLAGLAIVVVMIVKKKRGEHPGAGFTPGHQPHYQPPMGDAMRVLDERLARGEIEIDDYVARRSVLLGGPGMDYRSHGEAFGGPVPGAPPATPPSATPPTAEEPRPETPSQ